jgi:membrane protein YqaA with SNARE-associated domain
MSLKAILPMIGGVAGIYIARSNELGVLATFGSVFGGLIAGWIIGRYAERFSS